MVLPKNGDKVINECPNCDFVFEETQVLGAKVTCDEDEGGCGFCFKLLAVKRSLETDE